MVRFWYCLILAAVAALDGCAASTQTMLGRSAAPTASACQRARRLAGRTFTVHLPVSPGGNEGRTSREYVVHVPAGYTGTARTPLVLFFHGAGGSAARADTSSGWSQLADRDRFLIVYPQGLPFGQGGPAAWAGAGPSDYGIDDIAFVRALLMQVKRRFCVAADAVFATGMSSGGGMAGYLACALSTQIAAAAPVAGNHYNLTILGCRPRRPVALLEVHGTADPVVPYHGIPNPGWPLPSIPTWVSTWAQLDHCRPHPAKKQVARRETLYIYRRCARGGGVEFYRLRGGGHVYPATLGGQPTDAVIYRYLMAHTRSTDAR